jgi:hypothetical protein
MEAMPDGPRRDQKPGIQTAGRPAENSGLSLQLTEGPSSPRRPHPKRVRSRSSSKPPGALIRSRAGSGIHACIIPRADRPVLHLRSSRLCGEQTALRSKAGRSETELSPHQWEVLEMLPSVYMYIR